MPLTIGTLLGRYEVVAPLGAGGMGEVYRAKDRRLGREVTIKLLPAEVASHGDRPDMTPQNRTWMPNHRMSPPADGEFAGDWRLRSPAEVYERRSADNQRGA